MFWAGNNGFLGRNVSKISKCIKNLLKKENLSQFSV